MPPQGLMEKIKKLHAMSESAKQIGNEAEAAAFAGKVQDLLMEHKLDMAEIDMSTNVDIHIDINQEYFDWSQYGMENTAKSSAWKAMLAHAVAINNNCKVLSLNKTNRLILIGSADSRQVVSYMIAFLAQYGEDAVEKGYRQEYYKAKKDNRTYIMKGWRRSFMFAYVDTVRLRLEEAKAKMMAAHCHERGLMVLNKEDQAVEDFVAAHYPKLTHKKSVGAYNAAGQAHGTRAGQNVNIHSGGIGVNTRGAIAH